MIPVYYTFVYRPVVSHKQMSGLTNRKKMEHCINNLIQFYLFSSQADFDHQLHALPSLFHIYRPLGVKKVLNCHFTKWQFSTF